MTNGTEREIVELREVNQILKMFIACNQVLLDVEGKVELARKISEIVVEKGGYVMCWVGFPEEGNFVPVAYMQGEGYVEGQRTNWETIEKTDGFAMETVQDVVEVDPKNIWGEKIFLHHGRFFVSFPLMYKGEWLGCLLYTSPSPRDQ
ncbi:MAG: hypothetical protein N2Z84_03875, partial [Atribacterota bacterium]|nr:hypothetical protein [Atribacterota bacterium]